MSLPRADLPGWRRLLVVVRWWGCCDFSLDNLTPDCILPRKPDYLAGLGKPRPDSGSGRLDGAGAEAAIARRRRGDLS